MKNKIKSFIFNLFGESTFSKFQAIYWVKRLRKNKFYEKEIDLLSRFVKPGSVSLDIGANFGQYTYPLSKLVGATGKVFSFEPANYTFKILKNIVKKLKLTNVEIQNIALSDKNGEAEIITPVCNSGMPNIGEAHLWNQKQDKEGKRETVKVATLDNLILSSPFLNKVTFIKCDVEGAEMLVFRGGRNLLSKYYPVILCEIEKRHTERYGYEPDALFTFFKDLGYKAFVFISGRLVLVQGIQESAINYTFIHESFIDKNI